MKKIFRVPTALCTAFAAAQTLAAPTAVTQQEAQTFQSADPAHFSAAAEFARLPQMPSHGDVNAAIVRFTPNAVTDWHSHAQGQYLIVTEGTGHFQEWGKPVQTIKKGDVV